MFQVISRSLGLLLVAMVIAGGYWLWSAHQPVQKSTERFVIQPGEGVSTVAGRLVDQDILDEPYSLILWSYQRGYTRTLKTGEYRIERGTTLIQLLQKFVDGDVISYAITFIEGWRFKDFLDQLARHPKLRQTVAGQSSTDIMTSLGHPDLHPEGRFFPDTYIFSAATTDLQILRQAFQRMRVTLEQEWNNRDSSVQLKDADEALILASIIEKETGNPLEREVISAVFHNRLSRNMRLQADPTVIYGLGDQYNGNLKRTHLKQDTPYNTYTRLGLPPTPIANPGREAIHAALHPAQNKALYFVSRGDGSHKFSETLKEHNDAVIKYQLAGRKKSFSSSNDSE